MIVIITTTTVEVQQERDRLLDHHRIFGGAAAQPIVAQFADSAADAPSYEDFVAVDGKANC
jgi:hypothetical protein